MILSGRDLRWYIECGQLKIDPVLPEQFQQNGVDLILDRWEAKGYGFYLGVTRERLELPNDLMAFVQLRSTWARRGIMLPPTIVDAGFKGDLTLEILLCSPEMLEQGRIVPIGQRFAHLIFAKTSSPCEPYAGKYQGQSGITEARADADADKS